MPRKYFLPAEDTGLRASLLVDQVRGITLFGPKFNRDNQPFYFTQSTMSGPYAEAIKPKHTWAKRETGCLWWTTMAQTLKTRKAVRIHCARRLRHAFVQSLKAHGYDSDGLSLFGKKHRGLMGTLEMHSFRPLLSAKFDDIKAETDRMVKWVEEQQTFRNQIQSEDDHTSNSHRHRRFPSTGETTVRQVYTKKPHIHVKPSHRRKVIPLTVKRSSTSANMVGFPQATRPAASPKPAPHVTEQALSRPSCSNIPQKAGIGVQSVRVAARPRAVLDGKMSPQPTTSRRRGI